MQGRLFIVSGCSGVGKSTLLKKFMEKNPQIKYSVSDTTRAPREGEKHGVNYFFVSKDEFKKSIEKNEFLEWTEFSGNYYGTKKNFVQKTLEKCVDLILELEVKGAAEVKRKIPEAKTIFIMPPNMKVLEERLRGRKTESESSVLSRLNEAKREMEAGKHFDYKVINDKLETALESLQKIFDRK